jgi:hypothetical protein
MAYYYIYRHVRLDKDEPFYIGIGHNNSKHLRYKRAYQKSSRNKYWKNIVNKTEYLVEILVDGLSKQEGFNSEVWWISFYGRKDLNKGTLVNLTDGGESGEGRINKPVSEETKKKISIAGKNRNVSQETRDKISAAKMGNKSLSGRTRTDSFKERISESNFERWNTPGYKEHMSNKIKEYWKRKKLENGTKDN